MLAKLLWHFDLENCVAENQDWRSQMVYIAWEKQPQDGVSVKGSSLTRVSKCAHGKAVSLTYDGSGIRNIRRVTVFFVFLIFKFERRGVVVMKLLRSSNYSLIYKYLRSHVYTLLQLTFLPQPKNNVDGLDSERLKIRVINGRTAVDASRFWSLLETQYSSIQDNPIFPFLGLFFSENKEIRICKSLSYFPFLFSPPKTEDFHVENGNLEC